MLMDWARDNYTAYFIIAFIVFFLPIIGISILIKITKKW